MLDDPYLVPRKPADMVRTIAEQSGVSPEIADDYLKLTQVESGQNVKVRDSGKGAKGFGQVMPDVKGGTMRTVGGRKYDLSNPSENIAAGLSYFAEGGSDPVARRLHYFGGPRARQTYERTGRIPNISDGNMTAAQYVQATGGYRQSRQDPYLTTKPTKPAEQVDDPYLVAKPSGQTPLRQTGLSKRAEPAVGTAIPSATPPAGPSVPSKYDTRLAPDEERAFRQWKAQFAPNDSGADYDLRGAYKAGLKPDSQTRHWPDKFKKPNHPTFSNESQYAVGDDARKAGHWEGDKFIPPPSVPIEQVLAHVAQQANKIAPRLNRRFPQKPQKPQEPQVIDAGNAVELDPETMRPREASAMQARVPSTWERVKEAVGPYVPGLTSLDTPGGIKTDPIRGAISGLTLGAFGDPRQVSREEQILDPEAQAKADLAHQVGQFAPAVVPYMAVSKVLSAVPLLSQATRTANIARTALTFGGVELGREAVRAVKTDIPLDPKEIAISTAIGASIGGIAGVDPSLKRRVVAFVTPSVVADVARGTDPQTATFNVLTNLGFALTGHGERGAKDAKADVPASLRNDPQVRELIDRARADVRRAIDEKGGPAQGEATTPDRKAAAKQAFRLPLIEPNELTGRLKGQLSKPLEITYESESGKELTRTTTIEKRLKELSRKQDVLDRLVDCLHG